MVLAEFDNHPVVRRLGAHDLQLSVRLIYPEIDWEWVISDELSRQVNGGFAVDVVNPIRRNADNIGFNLTIIRSTVRPLLYRQIRIAELSLRKNRSLWLKLWSQHASR